MHILVTNDDGPPSSQSSPYVRCLVKHLQDAGHVVSVCLPHTQRSWIGKAHMIGQTLRPTYYRPSAGIHGEESLGTTHTLPSPSGDVEEWVLIDGTPASSVQIGLHHFFKDRGPVDLVVSGPNYGRNTTAVFALSSGTLGAALEAAVCKRKSIALSFAFFTRNHDPVIIEAACRHSVKVINALYEQWPTDDSVDLYSVNVPLVEGVESHKTLFTEILQNYWREGSCFEVIEAQPLDGEHDEAEIRKAEVSVDDTKDQQGNTSKGHTHKHFKWSPKFADVYKSVDESAPGNDGWAVKEGQTSITPLKANFAVASSTANSKELKLTKETGTMQTGTALVNRTKPSALVEAVVSYGDSYVQPILKAALGRVFLPGTLTVLDEIPDVGNGFSVEELFTSAEGRGFQISGYEAIDFDFAASHQEAFLINSYMIRKAVIRKHYLSTTIDHWVAKNASSILKSHFKRSEAFEVDYAEFLDDALVEAFDLRDSLTQNAEAVASVQQWWILKPGMSDRGQGIKLFSTMEDLQSIFDTWEKERPDSDDEEDGEGEGDGDGEGEDGDYITASHLRHFVAQPYIHPPLLLEGDGRKFHVRTYVLCVGCLSVYVYKPMLALFAAKPYSPPWESSGDIESFLTNTCLQGSPNENAVRRFWDLPLPQAQLDDVFGQMCKVTGELFEAAARAMPIHFQTLPNAFEVFGLDFLIDAGGRPYLLEVNAFPDFKQTGVDLQDIVSGFWEGVLRCAVAPFFGLEASLARRTQTDEGMVLVRRIDLGR